MNLKKSIAASALVLAFGVTSAVGVSAQTVGDTQVELENDPSNTCTVVAGAGGDLDFGTATWNGTSYSAPTNPTVNLSLTVTDERAPGVDGRGTCYLTVSATDLGIGLTPTPAQTIGVANLSINGTALSTSAGDFGTIAGSVAGTATDVPVALSALGITTEKEIGTYTGTITIEVSHTDNTP